MSWHRSARAGDAPALSPVVGDLAAPEAPAACLAACVLIFGRLAETSQLTLTYAIGIGTAPQLFELTWNTDLTPSDVLAACCARLAGAAGTDSITDMTVTLVNEGDEEYSARYGLAHYGPSVRFSGHCLEVIGSGISAVLLNQVPLLLQRAFEHLRARPSTTLARLDLLPPAAACALVDRYGDGPRRCYESGTVLELIERQVQQRPDAQAVADDHGSLSYAALWQRAGSAAAGLLASGEGPGRRVGVLMERGIEWIVAIVAVLRAGAVYVPLNAKNPVARNRRIVEQASIALVIGEGLQDLELPARGFGRTRGLAELESAVTGTSAPTLHVAPDDDAYCIFTSGSTGEPKGIRMPHRAFANFVQACPEVFGTSEREPPRHLQFCEASFDVHIFEVFHPLSLGGTVVIDKRDDIISFDAYVQRLERQRVDIISPPTTFWHHWREQLDAGNSRIPATLRRVIVGGEMAQPGRFSRTGLPPALHLLNGYGPAETNYATVHSCAADDESSYYVPVGRPLPNLSVYVLDTNNHLLPQGAVGEIAIGGLGVAKGYIDAAASDMARFFDFTRPDRRCERCYRSGDLGYVDAAGRLVCLGRADDQLKIHGVRVEPGDVEAHLRKCADVRQAVVFGLRREDGSVTLAMVLELAPNVNDVGAVVDELAAAVPYYMVPRHYALVTRWPLSTNGKIDRHALQGLPLSPLPAGADSSDVAADETLVESTSPTLATLERLWQRVCRNSEPVPRHVDLRRLQLSSLGLGMFFAEVFDHFDLDVPPAHFFALRTLRDVAREVDRLLTLLPRQPAAQSGAAQPCNGTSIR